MKRQTLLILFASILLLTACAPAGGKSASPAPATAASANTAATSTRQPGCTLKSRQATPDPTLEALLPPPTSSDWVKGPSDAYVTIIEYSDFQ